MFLPFCCIHRRHLNEIVWARTKRGLCKSLAISADPCNVKWKPVIQDFLLQSMPRSLQPTLLTQQISLSHYCRMAAPTFNDSCRAWELVFTAFLPHGLWPCSNSCPKPSFLACCSVYYVNNVFHPSPCPSPRRSSDKGCSCVTSPTHYFLCFMFSNTATVENWRYIKPNPTNWGLAAVECWNREAALDHCVDQLLAEFLLNDESTFSDVLQRHWQKAPP